MSGLFFLWEKDNSIAIDPDAEVGRSGDVLEDARHRDITQFQGDQDGGIDVLGEHDVDAFFLGIQLEASLGEEGGDIAERFFVEIDILKSHGLDSLRNPNRHPAETGEASGIRPSAVGENDGVLIDAVVESAHFRDAAQKVPFMPGIVRRRIPAIPLIEMVSQ